MTNAHAQTSPTDLDGVSIAVYYGDPSSSASSRTALQLMFEWMNATVDILYASDINNGGLSEYDMVVIPGGWAGTYNEDLAGSGITEIREFVRDGGSFFGVCAGAYFGCDLIYWEGVAIDYPLGLFAGNGIGPVEEIAVWPDYAMAEIILNHSSSIIDFSGEPANHTVMYYGGPWFDVSGHEDVHTLATFAANNQSAMIAFEYEEGRVFLSGPHPEWEEDSNRDNSSWENGLDDKGSEWNMMLSVALWLVENHSTTPTTTTSPTTSSSPPPVDYSGVLMMAIGAAAITLALLLTVKKRAKNV
ncbi:MAG: BPL-N domain-containing protein [Promethearchaeota archaeon]